MKGQNQHVLYCTCRSHWCDWVPRFQRC